MYTSFTVVFLGSRVTTPVVGLKSFIPYEAFIPKEANGMVVNFVVS